MTQLTIKATEAKEGDKLKAIGGFVRGLTYEDLTISSVETNTWSDSVTLRFENKTELYIILSRFWNLDVEREDEKAIYMFKNHSPVHEKLLPNSQLFRNATVVLYKGEIVKSPED